MNDELPFGEEVEKLYGKTERSTDAVFLRKSARSSFPLSE
jgi:hypothetical protein